MTTETFYTIIKYVAANCLSILYLEYSEHQCRVLGNVAMEYSSLVLLKGSIHTSRPVSIEDGDEYQPVTRPSYAGAGETRVWGRISIIQSLNHRRWLVDQLES